MWIAKTLILATRKPFPSKIKPAMVFIDAINSKRGILSVFPNINLVHVNQKQIVMPKITLKDEVMDYITDVQQRQINKMYLLKKPDHKIEKILLCYLPVWKVNIQTELVRKKLFVNVNNGYIEDIF